MIVERGSFHFVGLIFRSGAIITLWDKEEVEVRGESGILLFVNKVSV